MDDLDDVEDGCDEIANVSNRQTADEAFETSGGQLPRYSKTGPGSPVKGPPIRRLADLRFTDHLDPNEARDVIRSAKADDPSAKERLVKCFQKGLIKIAGRRKYDGPAFEDRLKAAWEGFWKALARYNLNSNNGFWAFAVKFIEGAVVDCVHDHHRRGGKLETRQDRKNRSNGSVWRPGFVEYNGIEKSHDEDGHDADGNHNGKSITGWSATDDHELRECDGSGGKVTDAAWATIVAGRAVPTNYPNWRAPLEPCKPISRERYEEDQAQAYRFDTAAYVQQRISDRLGNIGRNLGVPRESFGVDENPNRNGGRWPKKSRFPIPRFEGIDDGRRFSLYAKGPVLGDRFAKPALSSEYPEKYPTPNAHKINAPTCGNAPALGIIGYLAKDADERALRRLKQVGRVRYAQELAAKDRDTVANRPLHQHLYAGAVRQPLKWNRSKRYAPIAEEMLAHGRATHAQPIPPQVRKCATARAEPPQHSLKSKLRLIKGIQHGRFNHPGTINNALHGSALHRNDGGDHRGIRKASGTSS